MNKNTRRLIYSIVVLIVIGVITAVLGTMPVKNGLESLEKAGWFALFFIITIVVAIVVFVNIVICLVAEELVEGNGGKTMYKYEKTDWEKLPMERSNIGGMEQYENAENHSLFIGQVITLFGQPEYWSENNEDMCSWAVAAINEAGEEIYLEIYYGASGPAIGGGSDSDSKKAAEELMELIKKAEPADFHHKSIYEDFGVKVEMGVKDGKPYYNSEMGEDMFE